VERRTTIEFEGEPVDILGIEDLVRAKKTQLGKDWSMIQRLIERHYFDRPADPSTQAVNFWLRELRTPELLVEAAAAYPDRTRELAADRPALHAALAGDSARTAELLEAEEREERRKDCEYWEPLRRELEQTPPRARRRFLIDGTPVPPELLSCGSKCTSRFSATRSFRT
jgi:hypothetical protein